MQNKEALKKSGDVWLGISLLGTSILILFLTRSVHSIGLGNNFDPGPKTFPIGISALLLIGAIVEFSKLQKAVPNPQDSSKGGTAKAVILLLCTFLIYVALVPWAGFSLSTVVMATIMMVQLGNPWKLPFGVSVILILGVSVILTSLVYLLFIKLLKVPLPGGILNLPF